MNRNARNKEIPRKDFKATATIPYIPGLTENIKHILENEQIRVTTKPMKTIKDVLPKQKDKLDSNLRRGAVYKIPCKNCDGVYIGETGRNVTTRIKEHKRDLNPHNMAKLDEKELKKKSALVKHVFNQEHCIDFNKYEILEFEPNYNKRRFLESFYIHQIRTAFNDKENCFYSKIYSKISFNHS